MESVSQELPKNESGESLITVEPAQEIPMRSDNEWDQYWWSKGKDWGTVAGILADKKIYRAGETTPYATVFILAQRKYLNDNPLRRVESVTYVCGVRDENSKKDIPISEALPILKENLAGIFKFAEESK